MTGTFGSINAPFGAGDVILTDYPEFMGKEKNKQTTWDLWKHFVEQEKGVYIQQSQNKSIFPKTVYCKLQKKKTQKSSTFNKKTWSIWKRPHILSKINAIKPGYVLEKVLNLKNKMKIHQVSR